MRAFIFMGERHKHKSKVTKILHFRKMFFPMIIIGAIGGFFLGNIGRQCDISEGKDENINHDVSAQSLKSTDKHFRERDEENLKLMFVGIQTKIGFLSTRATAAFDTWIRSIHGDSKFFVGGETAEGLIIINETIPITLLPEVNDDSYPPQKKSFHMLKYMHDHYIDKYEWFARADDDVFLKGEELAKYLSSLDSRELYYIGQSGKGRPGEIGKLGLPDGISYCLGGPGVILSRATLAKMAPHMKACLQNIVTSHEDTELGICIHRYTGISCTEDRQVSAQCLINRNGRLSPLLLLLRVW